MNASYTNIQYKFQCTCTYILERTLKQKTYEYFCATFPIFFRRMGEDKWRKETRLLCKLKIQFHNWNRFGSHSRENGTFLHFMRPSVSPPYIPGSAFQSLKICMYFWSRRCGIQYSRFFFLCGMTRYAYVYFNNDARIKKMVMRYHQRK